MCYVTGRTGRHGHTYVRTDSGDTILSKTENFTWSSKGDISLFRKGYVISMVICDFKLNLFVLLFLFFDFALKIMLLFGEIWHRGQIKKIEFRDLREKSFPAF